MKSIKLTLITAGLAAASILAVSGTSYAAGNASFALSPANSSVTEGATTSVAIYENGTNVNVVTATFSYDASMLQLVGDNCAGVFTYAASNSSSISCFVPGGTSAVSGSNEVAVLSFKTITIGTGSVTVNGSTIASNGSNAWNGVTANASITISAPPTPTNPSQPTQGSGSKTSGSSSIASKTNGKPANGSAATTSTKPSTTTNSTTTTNTSNTNATAGMVKGDATTNKAASQVDMQTTAKTSHVGPVVSSIVALLVIVAAATYWFIHRKRELAVPAKVVTKNEKSTANQKKAKKAVKKSSKKS
jgi:hypothetical protein